MSNRPVFKPTLEGDRLVETLNIEFTWFPGFSVSQKQKSIQSLHEEAIKTANIKKILEISTKSENEIGVRASAFNLKIRLENGDLASVESFYQGSKVFKHGGPYIDIYKKNSYESKKDERLQSSGDLVSFTFEEQHWDIDEYFYDWLYLNALIQNKEIATEILQYEAYTDIEFNPKKSYNCQAHTAALFKALTMRKIDLNELRSPKNFKKIIPKTNMVKIQPDLFS